MSHWTYITGAVEVTPAGETQPQLRYVLDTVLEHLPVVSGSEGNMKVHVLQQCGHNFSSSCNEFEEDLYCRRDADHDGWRRLQERYTLVLEARLRDREFDETKRELNKWLNRLAKRVLVTDILVKLSGGGRTLVLDDPEPYSQMTEPFSWWKESGGKPAWVEYLLWESAPGTRYPLKLMYKYYEDPEISAELARRLAWERGIVTPPGSQAGQKACGASTEVVQ